MLEWIDRHEVVLWWLLGISGATFVGTLIAIPIVVVRMPADYFSNPEPAPDSWRGRHQALRFAFVAAKNALGFVLVIGGILLLVLPGQGIVTLLIGISLLDFPGKRRLEQRIARERHVLRAINWMRAKAKRPPLEVPPGSKDAKGARGARP